MAGRLLASGLAALALVGVTTATAQAGDNAVWDAPFTRSYSESQGYYPMLKTECRSGGGTVIRLWVHDYAYNPPNERFKAWVACQWD